ncbi:MAG: UDP-N-acetylglucosamine--N-acetylmuramyl-(pentapeptide) pyrophosphoryl-undecaprenol N-acetylglucosamine transferase [Euryarchaeota archaeon]|nr:UDP-N-acetylglucosamine--N-acetylmuramyl-(pentapeptide) pyrophosphoryl-undecaprenol N-acetylglucosamine transferase [Euryarchaeota archaeon]
MKALFMITGRGIGGDAVTAHNIAQTLSKYDIQCEFALDPSASGLLFKKKNLIWHKTPIPQAGGHAATKLNLVKAGFRTLQSVFEAIKLYRKIHPDVVVGIIGGGAVVGCLAAKMSNIPSVGIVATPYDSKIVSKITTAIVLPESPYFKRKIKNEKIKKAYLPVNPEIINGNRENALKKLPDSYDKNLKTILISSGSILFEKMAHAASKVSKSEIDANIVVVGNLRNESLRKNVEKENIIYLGYTPWMNDLYRLADISILSDDGVMVHEALACELPVITLGGVKYGRYHGMAEIFKGAVVEGDLEDIEFTIKNVFNRILEMKTIASSYGEDILKSSDKIAEIIYNLVQTKKVKIDEKINS